MRKSRRKRWTLTGNQRWGVFLVSLIVLWEITSRLRVYPPMLLPPPEEVARSLWLGIADRTLVIATLASLRRILIGFAISLVLGISLGGLIARFRPVADTIGRMVVSLQTVPSIAWLPFALLWFGLNEKAVIFVVVIGSTLPITISFESGIRNIPITLIRTGKMMGTSNWQLLRYVVIPACIPSLTVGMRNAWAFAWRSLLAGELLVASKGLGQVLTLSKELNDTAQVFAVMFIIGLMGYAIDQGMFRRLESYVAARWDVAVR